MSEDLKPRGEKSQWWLAVRPSVLYGVAAEEGRVLDDQAALAVAWSEKGASVDFAQRVIGLSWGSIQLPFGEWERLRDAWSGLDGRDDNACGTVVDVNGVSEAFVVYGPDFNGDVQVDFPFGGHFYLSPRARELLDQILHVAAKKAEANDVPGALDSYQERLLAGPRSMLPETVAVVRTMQLYVHTREEGEIGQKIADLSDVADVFAYGADKYSAGNFRAAFHDPDSMRREYFSAIMRHLLAFWTGEELDPESGLPHTAHALCGALMLLEMEKELVK